jgi:anti-anti-sigma factor
MEISARYRNGVAILDVVGEIIGESRFDLNKTLQEEIEKKPEGLILNLEEVPMMDSVGLGMLVGTKMSIQRAGYNVALEYVGRSVRYLLVVTKLDQEFHKFDDEGDALEWVKDPEAYDRAKSEEARAR